MARRPQQHAEAPGQDSFLDVVANLVGIIIILIIVVGVATKKAVVEHGTTAAIAAASAQTPAANLDDARAALAAVESDIYRTAQKMQREQLEVSFRRAERDRVLAMISAAERGMKEQREKLDEPQKAQFDLEQSKDAAQRELEQIERDKLALERSRPTKGIIEHLPTPMAKTVFGREIHMRLGNGRLAFVPWDDLVERLKNDASQKMYRLKDSNVFTETLGPVDGFWIRYTIKKTEQQVTVRGGVAMQQRAELDRFVIVPVAEDVGETVEQALRADSDFMARFEKLDPSRTTVTVWVYPDSFHHFRTFKKLLFDRGFLTAARPLPDGHPIGGSPEGTRSNAE